MSQLQPFPLNPEHAPWSTGPLSLDQEEIKYTITSHEALVAHFTQWLPQDYVISVIENEKQVFVVRKEVSLEETRLQFLKKCENALLKTLSEIQSGRSHDWGYGVQPGS